MSSALYPVSISSSAVSLQLRKGAARKWLPLISASILFVALLALLLVRIAIIQKSYGIEELRQQNLSYDQELRQLRLELESAVNPQRLRGRAQRELGMKLIKPQQVRQLLLETKAG